MVDYTMNIGNIFTLNDANSVAEKFVSGFVSGLFLYTAGIIRDPVSGTAGLYGIGVIRVDLATLNYAVSGDNIALMFNGVNLGS